MGFYLNKVNMNFYVLFICVFVSVLSVKVQASRDVIGVEKRSVTLSCSIVADVLVWIRLQDKIDITAERNVHWTANGDSKFEIVGKTLKINGLIASEDAGVYECSNNQESDKTNLIVYVSPTEVFMGSEYVDEEVIITCRTNVREQSD